MTRDILLAVVACALAGAPACTGDTTSPDPDPSGTPPSNQPPGGAAASGTIAYARGYAIRLVEPDGTGDRLLWSAPNPEPSFSVRGLAWRPDGAELAFSSDHEMGMSLYERDIFAVSGDGARLRKLTNGPSHADLAALPKGNVTLRVQNNSADAGPYFVYVTGAAAPQSVLVPPATTKTLTFTGVADLGNSSQLAVAVSGAYRWYGAAAADVRAGSTVDAGLLIIGSAGLEHLGADAPAWRSDGSRVAFISGAGTCALRQVRSDASAGFSAEPLLDPAYAGIVCAYDWAPVASRASELLIAETDFGAGRGLIAQASEGSRTRGTTLVSYESYTQLLDLRWLPDGSGFLFAAKRYGSVFNESGDLYEYTFATKAVRQLTRLDNEVVRGFSISPDGQRIALERASTIDAPTSDVWVMRRDGSDLRLVARNARAPAWNPKRP